MFFFFVKPQTSYGLRISDWSSDVCSSDLKLRRPRVAKERPPAVHRSATSNIAVNASTGSARSSASAGAKSTPPRRANKIGRGSGRERGCTDVVISKVAGLLKKNNNTNTHISPTNSHKKLMKNNNTK